MPVIINQSKNPHLRLAKSPDPERSGPGVFFLGSAGVAASLVLHRAAGPRIGVRGDGCVISRCDMEAVSYRT